MPSRCKICEESFKNDKGLHMHISKIHKVTLAEYYVNFYNRKDLHSGELLPFKNKNDYFIRDFIDYDNFLNWTEYASEHDIKLYLIKVLGNRIKEKKLNYAPNHIELLLNKLPSIDLYKKYFGSYSAACEELKIKPLFNKNIMASFFQEDEFYNDLKILVDTREQQPLKFPKQMFMKLDFGDYAIGKPHYDYTYIDRKSESDFKSTFSTGIKRFRRELDRAKSFSSYLFILVESSIEDIIKNNDYGPHKANLTYIWHNVRAVTHDYAGFCQFIFSGSRENSKFLIPRLLFNGKKTWGVDMQYFVDKL